MLSGRSGFLTSLKKQKLPPSEQTLTGVESLKSNLAVSPFRLSILLRFLEHCAQAHDFVVLTLADDGRIDAKCHDQHRNPADNPAAHNQKRRDQTEDGIPHRMLFHIRAQIDQSAADEQRYDTDFCYIEISFLKYKKVELRGIVS